MRCLGFFKDESSLVNDGYFGALDPIFGPIRECEDDRKADFLRCLIWHGGFKCLN